MWQCRGHAHQGVRASGMRSVFHREDAGSVKSWELMRGDVQAWSSCL